MGGEGFIQMSRYCPKIEPPTSWSQTRNQFGKVSLHQDSRTKLDYPPVAKRVLSFFSRYYLKIFTVILIFLFQVPYMLKRNDKNYESLFKYVLKWERELFFCKKSEN